MMDYWLRAWLALGRRYNTRWPLRCDGCGYQLRGLRTSRCPECGLEFNADELRAADRQRAPRWTWNAIFYRYARFAVASSVFCLFVTCVLLSSCSDIGSGKTIWGMIRDRHPPYIIWLYAIAPCCWVGLSILLVVRIHHDLCKSQDKFGLTSRSMKVGVTVTYICLLLLLTVVLGSFWIAFALFE